MNYSVLGLWLAQHLTVRLTNCVIVLLLVLNWVSRLKGTYCKGSIWAKQAGNDRTVEKWLQCGVSIDCTEMSGLRAVWRIGSLLLCHSGLQNVVRRCKVIRHIPPGLTFSNSTFCPHSVFMCFVWIWEKTAIISLYNINWLVCITETECVYCAVRTGSLYTASLTFSNCTFCPHSVFMCFVWIWEQTAIISLYNINWLVCITETQCVYCAVRTNVHAVLLQPYSH